MDQAARAAQYYPSTVSSQWHVSYVDFTPNLLEPWGFLSSPKYERFDVLVQRANQWLQQHPDIRVKTCESIEVKEKSTSQGAVNTEKSTYWESGGHSSYYVRALRLWIMPCRPEEQGRPQQLGYLNVVPACIESGGFLSNPKFETFGQTIAQINLMFRNQPLQGKILTVETQEMKFKNWSGGIDPDQCFWREYGDHSTYFLNVIRVFFDVGPPAYEQIGCADFPPARTEQGGLFTLGNFEPMYAVVGKAHAWIRGNPGMHIVNVQTVDYKLKSTYTGELDTQRSLFRESGDHRTYYVRIVRVCYTTSETQPAAPVDTLLTCKTFMPMQITAGGVFSMSQFETMSETMKRAAVWFQHTGAKVISAETVPVRIYTGHQHGDPETTYTYNPGERSEHYLYVFRIFLDGVYRDPPPEVLPPAPVVAQQQNDCCTIL